MTRAAYGDEMDHIRMTVVVGGTDDAVATEATAADALAELQRVHGVGSSLKLLDDDGVELALFPVDEDSYVVRLQAPGEEPWAAHDTKGGGYNFEATIEGQQVTLRAPWRLSQDLAALVIEDY